MWISFWNKMKGSVMAQDRALTTASGSCHCGDGQRHWPQKAAPWTSCIPKATPVIPSQMSGTLEESGRQAKLETFLWGQSWVLGVPWPYLRTCVCAGSVVSDSLRPHGLQPATLLCLWDSPVKNILQSRLPFPFPGDLPNPGNEPTSPALADGFFTTEPPEKPVCGLQDNTVKIATKLCAALSH